MATLQVVPLTVNSSIYRREYWASEDVDKEQLAAFVELLDSADVEDAELCPNVQAGLESNFYDTGRLLLPATEAGVHYFQQHAHQAMTSGPVRPEQ